MQAELAKMLLWKLREWLTWEELVLKMELEAREAEEAEERGLRMQAWTLLSHWQVQREHHDPAGMLPAGCREHIRMFLA